MRGALTTEISKLMRIMTLLIFTGSCLGLEGFKMPKGKDRSFKELLEAKILLNFQNKQKFTSTLRAFKINHKNKANHSIKTLKAVNNIQVNKGLLL
tara:strand:+ start:167 stop:454 length:288 start_codon:yes stop_codon:yes gene_type:complete